MRKLPYLPRISSLSTIALLLALGCGGGSSAQEASDTGGGNGDDTGGGGDSEPSDTHGGGTDSGGGDTPATDAPTTGGSIQNVFVIMEENHSWSDIKGSASAPFINSTLLPMASHAENYFTPPGIHPSEPNYVWLEAGDNLGITTDDDPGANHRDTTLHLVS